MDNVLNNFWTITSPTTGRKSYLLMNEIAQIIPEEQKIITRDGRLIGATKSDLEALLAHLHMFGRIQNDCPDRYYEAPTCDGCLFYEDGKCTSQIANQFNCTKHHSGGKKK